MSCYFAFFSLLNRYQNMALTGIYSLNEPLSQRGLLWEANGPFCWLPDRVLVEARCIQCWAMLLKSPRKLDQAYFTTHPIHTRFSAPSDCDCTCISSHFYLEGRCVVTAFGWYRMKAPAVWKPFSAACNWVFFITGWSLPMMISQNSYKEIVPGQYPVCIWRRNKWSKALHHR